MALRITYKINIFNIKLKTIMYSQFFLCLPFEVLITLHVKMKSPTISIKLFISIRCNRKTLLLALKFSTKKAPIRSSSESNIYCKSHILHSFIINAVLWTFWLPRFMKVINHFQSVIDWLSSFQSGQARHKFNYIQIFYEYLTEIRYNTSVGGKKPLPSLPIWLFNFLESCNLKQSKKRLFYFKKDI